MHGSFAFCYGEMFFRDTRLGLVKILLSQEETIFYTVSMLVLVKYHH